MKENLEQILLAVSKSKLIDDGELTSSYRLVIKSLQEGLNLSRIGIWFVKPDYSEIICQLLIDTFHHTEIEKFAISAKDYPNYFAALKSERVILAHDAHTDPATSEFSENYLKPLSINSMLDVPIRHKGEMIGIICCEHIGQARQWTADEATFAGSMADLIGRAINANSLKKSEEKLRKINDELEKTVKERTSQLVESEKMAALGSLVAGVAHEVNTPLGISITASSTLGDTIKNVEKAMLAGRLSEKVFKRFLSDSKELMFLLENNLGRAAELVQNFKLTAVDHSDQSKHQFKLDETLQHLVLSLKPELSKIKAELSLDCPEHFTVYSFPSSWSQIISNLVLNSCKHAFANTAKPKIEIKVRHYNHKIYLDYFDNGCGVDRNLLPKIILPFYTTKRGQGGTGLGLAIIYNLVNEQLKGKITIHSDSGAGMHIAIECPDISLD